MEPNCNYDTYQSHVSLISPPQPQQAYIHYPPPPSASNGQTVIGYGMTSAPQTVTSCQQQYFKQDQEPQLCSLSSIEPSTSSSSFGTMSSKELQSTSINQKIQQTEEDQQRLGTNQLCQNQFQPQITTLSESDKVHGTQQQESFNGPQQQEEVDSVGSQPSLNNLSLSLAAKVGRVLASLAQLGDQFIIQNPFSPAAQLSSAFHSTSVPSVAINAYFVYVALNAGLTDHQSIIVLVLIERLCNRAAQVGYPIVISSLSIHRLILAAVLVTSKLYNDVFYGNHFVAYVGGVQLPEMNLLEEQFMHLIDWNLWVDPEKEFEVYLQGVLQHFYQQELEQQQQQLMLLQQQQQLQQLQQLQYQQGIQTVKQIQQQIPNNFEHSYGTLDPATAYYQTQEQAQINQKIQMQLQYQQQQQYIHAQTQILGHIRQA